MVEFDLLNEKPSGAKMDALGKHFFCEIHNGRHIGLKIYFGQYLKLHLA